MLHDTQANFSTITTPFGKTLYLADATTYEQVGIAVPGQVVSRQISGNFIIGGTCHDAEGPIAGCAIQVGKIIAYSDNRGEWSIRVKRKDVQAMAVLPSIFTTPGDWQVVSALEIAEPGKLVEIVVKRQSQPIPVVAKPTSDTVPTTAKADTPLIERRSFFKRLVDAMRGRSGLQ